jgi:hypothetical protein
VVLSQGDPRAILQQQCGDDHQDEPQDEGSIAQFGRGTLQPGHALHISAPCPSQHGGDHEEAEEVYQNRAERVQRSQEAQRPPWVEALQDGFGS